MIIPMQIHQTDGDLVGILLWIVYIIGVIIVFWLTIGGIKNMLGENKTLKNAMGI